MPTTKWTVTLCAPRHSLISRESSTQRPEASFNVLKLVILSIWLLQQWLDPSSPLPSHCCWLKKKTKKHLGHALNHRRGVTLCTHPTPPHPTYAAESTGSLYTRWYEVLAPYFCRRPEAAQRLLSALSLLWGQPFAAPTFALLLHQWLLVHQDAGGAAQRRKHLNILASGARQVFLGDVEAGTMAFAPLHAFLVEQVVMHPRLDSLPWPGNHFPLLFGLLYSAGL
jgi:hypothetical protein